MTRALNSSTEAGVARAFDDKAGAYAVLEATRRLAEAKDALQAKVIGVATTQEEIGTAERSPLPIQKIPTLPSPSMSDTPPTHPTATIVNTANSYRAGDRLFAKDRTSIPSSLKSWKASPRQGTFPTKSKPMPGPPAQMPAPFKSPNPASPLDSLHPLRYMHTPSEMVDLQDIEHTTTPRRLCPIPQSENGVW